MPYFKNNEGKVFFVFLYVFKISLLILKNNSVLNYDLHINNYYYKKNLNLFLIIL